MKGIQDYEIVQINEVSVNDKTTSVGVAPILAKVNSVYAKHDISTITLRIYPSNRRPDVVPRLRPSSGWSMFRIFSLVTAHREYLAMLNMPLIPLSCDIMNPKKSNSLPPKKDPIAIKDIMRKFQVNEPQASAVNAAITQRSGFVLIQGPPGIEGGRRGLGLSCLSNNTQCLSGTGKTKTILTMIGCLLSQSTVGNKISMPGSIGSSSSMMRAPIKQSATMSSGSAAAEKRRILCCAPSNAACDEIIKRLRMGIADFSGKKRFIPSVVRLGSVNSAHPDVKDVTLELLVEEKFMEAKEFQQFMRSTTASSERETTMKKELDSLTKHREELKLKLVAAEDGVTHDSISGLLRQVNDRRKDILRDLYERKEKKADNVKVLDNVKLMVRKKVLVDADVV